MWHSTRGCGPCPSIALQGFGQHDENLRRGREARDRAQASLRPAAAETDQPVRVGRFLLPDMHVSATAPQPQDESAGASFVGGKGRLAARQECAEHFLDRCGCVLQRVRSLS